MPPSGKQPKQRLEPGTPGSAEHLLQALVGLKEECGRLDDRREKLAKAIAMLEDIQAELDPPT